jgi:sulfotransferase
MKQIVLLSGLPRSGSTVLTSMLNQHPMIHASTTSPVADLVAMFMDNWLNISKALVDPPPQQSGNIITGIIQGAYAHLDKPVVVDKNRLWPRFAPHLLKATGMKPKIIATVRSIPDIMASYIILIEKNKPKETFVDRDLRELGLAINNKNRCKILLERYINGPYSSLKIGYTSGAADMLIVEYNDIVNNGILTVNRVCDFLNIPRHVVDCEHLQAMPENDEFHGGLVGLHDIRPSLKKASPEPEKIIGSELVNYYTAMKLDFWRR